MNYLSDKKLWYDIYKIFYKSLYKILYRKLLKLNDRLLFLIAHKAGKIKYFLLKNIRKFYLHID